MTLDYAIEKYSLAVRALAVGEGPLTGRLESAFFSIMSLSRENFPNLDLAQQHDRIIHDLTHVTQGPGEGHLHKTLNAMDKDTARNIAERIVDMDFYLKREREDVKDRRRK